MDPKLLTELGIVHSDVTTMYDNIEELRKSTPGMVIGTSKVTFEFSIDRFAKHKFTKGTSKVMSIYLYDRLKQDPNGDECLEPSKVKFKDIYRPYNGQDLTNKSILVWRTGGIGDLMFIQPNLYYLKKKYPSCHIIFSCAPNYFSLVDNWECIDELVHLPIDYNYFQKADYHVTFEGVIERCNEAKKVNAYKLFSRWMGLDIPDNELKPIQYTKTENNDIVAAKLKEMGITAGEFIGVQIRASSPIRTPSLLCWKNILTPLLEQGRTIVIVDRPDLKEQMDKFIEATIPPDLRKNVYNISKLSSTIAIAVSIIAHSKMVITPDSSFVHLSAALGVPAFSLYGPFPGHIRVSLYDNVDYIEPKPSDVCSYGGRYCCLHGHTPCPFNDNGMSPCFNNIDFEQAHEKINRLLQL